MKNWRNNWLTEKTQTIKMKDPDSGLFLLAKGSHLTQVYKSEYNSIVRRTPVTYRAIFPASIEMQKVNLVMEVIPERTIAALYQDGFNETGRAISLVINLFLIYIFYLFNIKKFKLT